MCTGLVVNTCLYPSCLSLVKAALAKEVLAEVPDQVTSYMFDNNIIPNNAPPPYTPGDDGIYDTPYS